MNPIRFAHVSDTHICRDYGKTQMKEVFAKCEDPADTLRRCLKKLNQEKLDFVLFTGDLVHEGEKEDYEQPLRAAGLPGLRAAREKPSRTARITRRQTARRAQPYPLRKICWIRKIR